MDNLWIYEQGRAVPENAQKPFSNGSFSGTDINPMWRIKKLTELFGPEGTGWYTEVLEMRAETYGDTVIAIVNINLYYLKQDGEWSKPVFGTGGNTIVQATKSGIRVSDEGYKKAYTDALSIACKGLGIGADIWYSNDVNADPTSKYSQFYGAPADTTPPPGWTEEAPGRAEISAASAEPLICERCGEPITGHTTKAGKFYDAAYIARKNKESYGQRLCSSCGWKLKNGGA